jgi:hypothetical protein
LDTTAQTLFVFEAEADAFGGTSFDPSSVVENGSRAATAKILATKPIEYLDVELTRELSDSVTGVKA